METFDYFLTFYRGEVDDEHPAVLFLSHERVAETLTLVSSGLAYGIVDLCVFTA